MVRESNPLNPSSTEHPIAGPIKRKNPAASRPGEYCEVQMLMKSGDPKFSNASWSGQAKSYRRSPEYFNTEKDFRKIVNTNPPTWLRHRETNISHKAKKSQLTMFAMVDIVCAVRHMQRK
jgi:hypothetical protein